MAPLSRIRGKLSQRSRCRPRCRAAACQHQSGLRQQPTRAKFCLPAFSPLTWRGSLPRPFVPCGPAIPAAFGTTCPQGLGSLRAREVVSGRHPGRIPRMPRSSSLLSGHRWCRQTSSRILRVPSSCTVDEFIHWSRGMQAGISQYGGPHCLEGPAEGKQKPNHCDRKLVARCVRSGQQGAITGHKMKKDDAFPLLSDSESEA